MSKLFKNYGKYKTSNISVSKVILLMSKEGKTFEQIYKVVYKEKRIPINKFKQIYLKVNPSAS